MSLSELKCPVCQGTGVITGGICENCQGIGFGIFWNNFFLFWGKTINRQKIIFEKIENIFRGLLIFSFLLFGLFGFAFLIWSNHNNLEELFTLDFWKTPSFPKMIFFFSLLSDLYLVYRLEVEAIKKDARVRIKKPKELKDLSSDWNILKKIPRKQKIDVSLTATSSALQAFKRAYQISYRWKHKNTLPIHLFIAFLETSKAQILFSRLNVDLKELIKHLQQILIKQEKSPFSPIISPELKRIFIEGYLDTQIIKEERVDITDLILPTVKSSSDLQEVLFDLKVDISKLENGVRWLQINDELRRRYHRFRRAALRRPKGSMNRAMTALETRFLDSFSDDLTLLAGRGYTEMCLDREKEFEEIFRIIEGEGRSVILVGERGVGKDVLLHGLAWRMIEDEVPSLLRDKRLVSLSIPKLISGATPTEAAERLMNCFYDIARAGNVVLAVPDIHNLIGLTAGEEGAIDLGDVFTSELEKGYFLVIATSNPQDYTQRIEGTALGNALQKVEIPEPETNQTIQILESKVGVIEYQTKVYFSYEALEKAVVLSQRLIHEKFLPQKAIEIIKETAQFVRSKRGAHQIVTGEDIAYIISQRTKIPVTAVTETESEKLLHLEQIMHERIVGQDEAVKAVASALRRARMELRETKRPIANFLFLGPTGVGKTETAKTLAEVYFGNENQMIRLDMSEYQTKEAVYRLIGLPGEAGGLLTEAVRKNPFSLLLLDEIEKAHPDILNLFLQVMDDGRLTDSIGRVIDFTNIILIATSNAGTSYIQEELKKGRPVEEIKKELVERELKDVFRPEFLNRFDAIVVFKPLAEQEIFQIAKLMLKKIAKQLETKGIFFEATDEAVAELAAAGFDPLFGARPLRRIIQERVQDSLANFLLTQKIERRDKIILEKGGMLRIEKARKW